MGPRPCFRQIRAEYMGKDTAVNGTVSWVPQHGVFLIDVETPRGAQQHPALHTALSRVKLRTDRRCLLRGMIGMSFGKNLPIEILSESAF